MNSGCQDKKNALLDKAVAHYAKRGIVTTRQEVLDKMLAKAKPKTKGNTQDLCGDPVQEGYHAALSVPTSSQSFIIDSETARLDKIFNLHVQCNISTTQFVCTENIINLVLITSENTVMIWNTETWENQMREMSVHVSEVLYFHDRWIGITCTKNCLGVYDIATNTLIKEVTNVQCYCLHNEMLYLVLKQGGSSIVQMLQGPTFSLLDQFPYSQDICSILCTADYIIATTHHEIVGWKPSGDIILILDLNNDTPSPLLLHNVTQYQGRLMVSVGLLNEGYTTYTVIVSLDKAGLFTNQTFLSEIQSGERVFVAVYYHYSYNGYKLSVHNIVTGNKVMSVGSDALRTVHDTLPLFVTSNDSRITIFRISNEQKLE